MSIKVEDLKPGDVLYDVHSYRMGNTMMREEGCWGAIYSDDRQDFMVSSGADGCVIVDKADIEALRALLETTP